MRRLAMLLLLAAAPAFAQTPPVPVAPAPSAPAQAQPPARGAQLRARLRERFEAANTTHDGRLTLAQAQAAHMPMLIRNFSAIDRDGKGYVTESDIAAFIRQRIAARRAQHQFQQPATGG
jgi:hypothetical protein